MLKNFLVESDNPNMNTSVPFTQREISTFLDAFVIVILKAFQQREKMHVKVILHHNTHKIEIQEYVEK